MKRNLGDVVHVKRGYGKNHHNSPQTNISYRGENYKIEIRKFDRNFDTFYNTTNISYTNMDLGRWRNLKILAYDDTDNSTISINTDNSVKKTKQKKSSIEFEYKCSETGNYVLELLYFDMGYNLNKCRADIYLKTGKGDYVKQRINGVWSGDDNNLNRHIQYFDFKKGTTYKIRYDTNINMGIIGGIIKKYDTYYGTRTNQGDLTIDSVNVKINEKIQPNEATVKIWYNHEMDDESNLSGYLFDFRDEINIYKKDVDDIDFIQLFGGYISTVDVDEKNLIMTLSCADRLIDGDNRYCMQEMVMLGGDSDEIGYEYSEDSYQSYDSRGEMLNYLTNIFELPLGNDNILNDDYLKRDFGYQYWYNKANIPKITTKNMIATKTDDFLICRNGNKRDDNDNSYDSEGNKPQIMTILDVSETKENILLNNNPNFWIRYGLGDAEKNSTNVEGVINTNSNINYISNTVRKFADKVTGQTGEGSVKAMWLAVAKLHYRNTKKGGFIWSPEETIKGGGNCCCKARLLGEMLTYKGVTGIQYVHIKKGSMGHVFLRLKKFNGKTNFIIDPTEKTEKKGWGHYLHYNGATITSNLRRITNFPEKPF